MKKKPDVRSISPLEVSIRLFYYSGSGES
jgi:hypothetical protein